MVALTGPHVEAWPPPVAVDSTPPSCSGVSAPSASAGARQLVDRAVRLINRRIGGGGCAGIRVGDRDPPERLAADLARRLPVGPVRIPQRVVLVGVAVRPPVDRDRIDVTRRIEVGAIENARQLIANL